MKNIQNEYNTNKTNKNIETKKKQKPTNKN